MPRLRVLDCTLRDGGYITDHQFRLDHAVELVRHLARAGIPYVEVGYFRPARKDLEGHKGSAVCNPAYLDALRPVATGTRLGVMIRPGDARPEDIHLLQEHGIQLIRMPVSLGSVQKVAALVAEAKRLDIQVAVNMVRASELTQEQLVAFAREVAALGPDTLYVADSNGNLMPWQVAGIFEAIRGQLTCQLGFHPHDGLSMALANVLEAYRAGATLVDASLGGMGKGGNLSTELLCMYLRVHHEMAFDIDALVDATRKYISPYVGRECLTRSEYAAASVLNINRDALLKLEAVAQREGQPLLDILLQQFKHLGAGVRS